MGPELIETLSLGVCLTLWRMVARVELPDFVFGVVVDMLIRLTRPRRMRSEYACWVQKRWSEGAQLTRITMALSRTLVGMLVALEKVLAGKL